MSDRELLELAAKAAGYWIVGPVEKYIVQPGHYENGFVIRNDRGGDSCWNPITDDGDALRLAVKLGLHLFQSKHFVRCARKTIHMPAEESKREQDPYAATRRAIVKAAAEIGKGMKDE